MSVRRRERLPPPILIIFEGPDEVGKTTLANALVSRLQAAGHSVVYEAFPGNEKGTLGHLVYQLHHDARSLGVERPIHPASQQTLHVAAHLDAMKQHVLPELGAGSSVVLDRFWWSTWVYGAATGVERDLLDKIVDVERTLWGSILPGALFLVRRDVSLIAERDTLWRSYEELAAREASRYPVYLLSNDGTIHEAVEWALDHLPPLAIE